MRAPCSQSLLSTLRERESPYVDSQWVLFQTHRSTAQMHDYLKLFMMPRAKDSEVDLLLKYYPNDQRAGCPFNTGIKNVLGNFLSTGRTPYAHATTRPAVQAYSRDSGRFCIPRPASILLEEQS